MGPILADVTSKVWRNIWRVPGGVKAPSLLIRDVSGN